MALLLLLVLLGLLVYIILFRNPTRCVSCSLSIIRDSKINLKHPRRARLIRSFLLVSWYAVWTLFVFIIARTALQKSISVELVITIWLIVFCHYILLNYATKIITLGYFMGLISICLDPRRSKRNRQWILQLMDSPFADSETERLFNQGMKAEFVGQLDSAQTTYEAALESDPENLACLTALAAVYYKQKNQQAYQETAVKAGRVVTDRIRQDYHDVMSRVAAIPPEKRGEG